MPIRQGGRAAKNFSTCPRLTCRRMITAPTAALYYCIRSLIVGIVGTLMVIVLPGDTGSPPVAYCTSMALITLLALAHLKRRNGRLKSGAH
jgi:hypothetical protein